MPSMPLVGGSLGFGQAFATTTYGTTLTAGGSANAKGTPQELIAATPHDAHWVEVMAGNPNGTNSYAIDILIDAATEAVLIPNLTFRARAAGDGGGRWLFPVFVPKGSRIAAQVGSSLASQTCLVAVNLFNAGFAGAGGLANTVDCYGTIANSIGQNLDCGGSANTDVTIQVTAATVRPHAWLVLTVANTDAVFGGTTKFLVDVCIGAATEVAILSDYPLGGAGSADTLRPDQQIHIPAFVPQGSRLTVRARCSSTTDGDRDLYVTVHGC